MAAPAIPPIRLGPIGTGLAVEKLHRPALRRLADRYVVTAFTDRSAEQSRRFADYSGAGPARAAADRAALLARNDVDAVLISVPIPLLVRGGARRAHGRQGRARRLRCAERGQRDGRPAGAQLRGTGGRTGARPRARCGPGTAVAAPWLDRAVRRAARTTHQQFGVLRRMNDPQRGARLAVPPVATSPVGTRPLDRAREEWSWKTKRTGRGARSSG